MNSLKIALLLSFAPCIVTASGGNCCDRAEIVQDEKCCTTLFNLAIFEAEAAYNASVAYISISGDALSDGCWEFIQNITTTLLGEAPIQTEDTLTFVFERNDLSLVSWFELLAQVEANYLEVQSTVSANQNCTGVIIEIGLNK